MPGLPEMLSMPAGWQPSKYVAKEDGARDARSPSTTSTGASGWPMAHMLHWLALCFVVAGASNDVITMTDHDFFRHTGTHEVMLVDFMSPWCVRCQQMAPSFAAAATALLKTNATVRFGEMDGSANPEIVKHFGVRTYPSLLIFVHGHAFPFDYTGVPNSKGFVEEMSHWQVPTDYVRTLTDDNLDDFVSHSDLMMVEFYAPWCQHCKTLAPEYRRAATSLGKMQPPIVLATLDAEAHPGAAERYNVTGFPTLKVFQRGSPKDYDGRRTAKDIEAYMVSISGPSSTHLTNLTQVVEFLDEDRHEGGDLPILIVYTTLETAGNNAVYAAYAAVSDEWRGRLRFAHVTEKWIGEARHMPSSETTVVMHRPRKYHGRLEPSMMFFNAANLNSAEGVNPQSINEVKSLLTIFVEDNRFSLADELKNEEEALFNDAMSGTASALVVVYFDVDFSANKDATDTYSDTRFWRNKVVSLAKEMRHMNDPRLRFAIAKEDKFRRTHLQDVKLDESPYGVNVIVHCSGLKYPYRGGEFTEDGVKSFLLDFAAAKVAPHIRSQPEPELVNSGLVQPIVGNTFHFLVENTGKDVFLMFYAPWCNHCKTLSPKLDNVAKRLKGSPNLIIAKLDATANEYPERYTVPGYPALYFKRGWNTNDKSQDQNEPIEYIGQRTVKHVIEFLREHSVHPVRVSPAKKVGKPKSKAQPKAKVDQHLDRIEASIEAAQKRATSFGKARAAAEEKLKSIIQDEKKALAKLDQVLRDKAYHTRGGQPRFLDPNVEL